MEQIVRVGDCRERRPQTWISKRFRDISNLNRDHQIPPTLYVTTGRVSVSAVVICLVQRTAKRSDVAQGCGDERLIAFVMGR